MKFKEENRIIYCKDESYNEKYDTNDSYYTIDNLYYYRGYLIHREDGPAVEWYNGDESWFLNGQLHREDGPAQEYYGTYKGWYLNGEHYSEEEYLKIINLKNKIRVLDEI